MVAGNADGHDFAGVSVLFRRDLHRLAALSEANAHQLLPIGEGTVHFVLAILVEVENDIGYDGGSKGLLLISFIWGSSVT